MLLKGIRNIIPCARFSSQLFKNVACDNFGQNVGSNHLNIKMDYDLFRKPVKCLLIDISGVLKNANEVIPGSIDGMMKLQRYKFPYKIVTNESQYTVKEIVFKLRELGFNIREEDIISPVSAVIKLIMKENLRPFLILRPNVKTEFDSINQENPNCVVIGDVEKDFNYSLMNEAFSHLMAMENPLILSLGKGKYYKDKNGLTLDVGPFTVALEYSVGTKARIIGKPDSNYFLFALNELGFNPENTIMIGDDVESDVGGAQKAGLRGVLVRTGKYTSKDENHIVKPDGIFNNFGEFISLLLENQAMSCEFMN